MSFGRKRGAEPSLLGIMPFVCFTVIFTVALAVWRNLFPEGILFYQGVVLAFLTGVLQGGWTFWRREPGATPWKDAAIGFLLAYSLMFTVPTTVDRSYSVQMLNLLAQMPEGATINELAGHFATRFVQHGGVGRRIQEQVATGSVVVDPVTGVVRLTQWGQVLTWLFMLDCRLFSCRSIEAPA